MVRKWKLPPPEGKVWVGAALELQILLSCNWTCHACDQFSNLSSISWVRKGTMTLDQIDFFCREMRENNAYIGRLRVLGGEPTLHPKFKEILTRLDSLKQDGHLYQLEVVSNGSNIAKLKEVKNLVKVRVSGQAEKEKNHTANMVHTPAELGYEGKVCSAPWHCGISLNYWGYFPCSAGAGLARMRDDLMPWQRLSLPLEGVWKTWPELQKLCNHCYHGLKPEDKIKCGTANYEKNVPSEEAWSHLAPWLHGKRFEWEVYGQS